MRRERGKLGKNEARERERKKRNHFFLCNFSAPAHDSFRRLVPFC